MTNIFSQVVTSRSYDDRLSTIAAVREAGISVCSGGILGLGEQDEDRVGLIHEVSRCVELTFGTQTRLTTSMQDAPAP